MRKYIKKVKLEGKTVGFVPTMGWLHEGHLNLIRRARRENDVVIISIFVNPTQFGPREDYERYPRDLKRDKKLAEDVGVDVIFAPTVSQMYLQGHSTYVNVERITEVLCGASRPGHFRGVTTICAKLFNIVNADIAYFGQKDVQQAIVVNRMVKDLNIPLKVKVMPIMREKDGLAMSSRNSYLNEDEKDDATVLYMSLQKARNLIKSGKKNPKKIISVVRRMIAAKKTAKIDYVEIVDTENLTTVNRISGEVLIALAVWIGKTRLIDNIIVKV